MHLPELSVLQRAGKDRRKLRQTQPLAFSQDPGVLQMHGLYHPQPHSNSNQRFVSFKKEGISEGRALYPTAERRHPLLFD